MKPNKLQMAVVAAAIVACSLFAVSATPALAARGGKSGGGNTVTASKTCQVSPNPVAAGAWFTVTGSNYGPGQGLTLAINSTGGTSYVWTIADSAGNFSATSRVSTTGSNTVKVHASLGGALLGSCSFSSY